MMRRRSTRARRMVQKELENQETIRVVTLDEDVHSMDVEKPVAAYPALTTEQQMLWKKCRLGDKDSLKKFLKENPMIDLNGKNSDGSTVLCEAATKAAQFSGIVEVLLEAGAGLEVADSLGNTPLHNAVLYYPSTQQTVDLLLEKGANVCAKNHEEATPVKLAEDKDLKHVLKELKKVVNKKNDFAINSTGYSDSPELKKKVFDKKSLEEEDKQKIIVKYDSPVVINTPSLLKKRKREKEDNDEFNESPKIRPKRIRWCDDKIIKTDTNVIDKDEINEVTEASQKLVISEIAEDDLNVEKKLNEKLVLVEPAESKSGTPRLGQGGLILTNIDAFNKNEVKEDTNEEHSNVRTVTFSQGFGVFVL